MTNSIFDPGIYYLNGYAWPHFIVGVLISLEGLFVYFASKKAVTHIAYVITTVTAGVWLTGVGIVCSMSDEAVALAVSRWYTWFGIIFITPAVYFFSVTWDPEKLTRRKGLIIFNYLCAAGFYLLCVASPWIVDGLYPYPTGFFPRAGILEPAFILWFYAVMTLSFRSFYRNFREAPTPAVRKNMRLMFLSFVIAFFGSVEYLPNYGIRIFPVAFLPMFLFTTIIGYCVVRYRLMDIQTVIHQTLMWLISSAIVILPFAGLAHSLQPWLRRASAGEATVCVLVFSGVFYFYYRSIQPRLGQLFQRQQANLQAVFEKFSKELVHLQKLRDLLQSFARLLRRRLYARRLSIYLLDEMAGEFLPVIAKGIRNLKPVPAWHPFLRWLEKKDTAVVAELVVSDPDVEAFKSEIEMYFESTQSLVAVPFVLGNKMIGVANLGRKSNLRKYGFREIRFLEQLKSPVTIAFSNSMRFEDIRKLSEELQRWNLELEQRVEDRTRELVKTQEQLIQAEKLATLGTLAGGVAHEINNPLTAVLTNAQILRMSAREDEMDSIALIEEGAKRCQGIVQKLMKYARKTAEEAPFRSVDLNEVVKSTLNLIAFQFKQENVEILTELEAVPPVPGIANELEQVLTNLLVNARDAVLSAKVKGRIVIRTRKTGDKVELIVQDNGTGIPKENLSKIFDPFFTTKDVGSGTGLGLAVSLGILKRHNATILADSIVGKGSTFTVRFLVTPPRSHESL